MAERLTFIHAADLHIGAPFRGLRALSERWASRLVEAIPEAYERVVSAAIDNRVDFVVIAGDIFDTARPSYADYLTFFDGLSRLDAEGIPVYMCTGNHDPYTTWQRDLFNLPGNVTMFSADKPSFALYRRDGKPVCVLGGRGYYNQTWPGDACIAEGVTRAASNEALGEDAASAPFGIGVIHTGLDLDPNKAPVAPAKLLRAGFDYWALGHVHKRLIYTEDNPRLAFSGCIQGRDIKETGPRGVNLVTLEEGRRNVVEFIPTASVVWQRMKVDISECVTVPDVSDLVTRELFRVNGKAHCGEMCTRIVLCGTTPLHEVLKRPGLVDDLRNQINDSHPEFFCDALIDKTRRPFDREAARREGMFPAVFLGVAESMREDEAGEAAFLQDEFLKSNVALPSALVQSIPTLAEEAQDLVIDLLCGGDDE